MKATDRVVRPGGMLAIIRLAAVPVFFAAERLVDHPVANSAPFGPLIAVAAVYAVVALVAELADRPLMSSRAVAIADLVAIAALVAASGGPFSQLRYAFFLLPIGAALLLRPALTAAASTACVALYGVIAISYPEPTAVRPDAIGFEFTQVLFLAWMGAAATLLSIVLTRSAREIATLATSRGRLVAQTLDAEDRARRRLAEALHDEALQNLLAARQLLEAGDAGSTALAREGLDEGVAQIRQAVFDLHPYLLEQAGLRAALQAIADRAGQRVDFTARVEVDPVVEGQRDQLLFSLARELIANAAKHSGARSLDVTIHPDDEGLALTVADDGRGIATDAVATAQANGHIGLASCVERAQAAGGHLLITSGPDGHGTIVRVRVPAAQPIEGPPPVTTKAPAKPSTSGVSRRPPGITMHP